MRFLALIGSTLAAAASSPKLNLGDNQFEFLNRCNSPLNVTIAAFPGNKAYTGPQPGVLGRHDSSKVVIPVNFNGHFLTGTSGSTVEYTAGVNQQLYVINNSEGFTVGLSIEPKSSDERKCPALTCATATCPCTEAIPPDSAAPCDSDPTIACFTDRGYKITFCPGS
ncbi:hypothetical protein EXIGLDRAFT_703729 [Exidia glandulosa HHB12029]|uniref:Osmotin, thaumatin-like protein n=1 Tax=Exidia glandulosa HHB12029 TaxID=1314781 RepID=A0A165ZCX7_EXIGL|nr:hypothetical protein EXIGLDRAFT_703729 [Exidia glandulosa HHB12029]